MGQDLPQWVELRVHGVSGTPPESLLASPHVKQVAGDRFSRFFRPVNGEGHELHADDGHIVEGYHWGQFTSGSWRAGLWLVLVPFGLINAAQFMLPGIKGPVSKVFHGLCGSLLRLLALLLTCLITFTFGFVLIDLIGWRWAARTRMLKNFEPSAVLAAAVVLSALSLVALFLLGKGFGVIRPDHEADPQEVSVTPLGRLEFYRGDADASTLRRLHLVGGLSLIALMAAFVQDPAVWSNKPLIGFFTGFHGWSDRPLIGVLASALLMATAIIVIFLGDPEGSVSVALPHMLEGPREKWHKWVGFASKPLVIAAVVLVAASAIHLNAFVAPHPRLDRIEIFDGISNLLMYVGVITLILLFFASAALAWTTRSTNRDPRAPEHFFCRYAWGMTAYLVTSISVFIGVGLSAAVATAVSTSLDLDIVVDESGNTVQTSVGTTPMLDRISYAWGLTVLMLVGVALMAVGHFVAHRRHYKDSAEAMHAQPPEAGTQLPPDGWITRIARSLWIARMKTKVPILFWAFAAFGALLSIVVAYEIGPCNAGAIPEKCRPAGFVDFLSQPRLDGNGDFLTIFGAWSLLATAAGLVTLSRGAVKTQTSRRGVNVIWDVISFWPHAVHPFVPRPYSQRTVVDLRDRIRWHLGRSDAKDARQIVVCGHSQGSLISFTALLLLTQDERNRVGLVTFGSQLRLIFPRAFPAFVNLGTIGNLYAALDGAWINLYRATDPLAGPVLSWNHSQDRLRPESQHFPQPYAGRLPDSYDAATRRRISGADWRLLDPTPHDADLQTGPVTRIYGHSEFWDDPDWQVALSEVVGVVRLSPPGTETQ
ncbi:MAG: hypothetical protein ABIR57_02085 [Aeromicrobium sp.]